jgi:hypothetical protein
MNWVAMLHTVAAAHSRSVVSVGAAVWKDVALHGLIGTHVASVILLPLAVWNDPSAMAHTVVLLQRRLEVAVGAAD